MPENPPIGIDTHATFGAGLGSGALANGNASPPGPAGILERDPLLDALHALEVTAMDASYVLFKEASVRERYVRKIKEMSKQVLRDVHNGVATAEDGAQFANQMRNIIMEESRLQSTSIGRAMAEKAKIAGQSLEEAIQKATGKIFPGQTFEQLSRAARRKVFQEIIEASGRSRPSFTSKIPKWRAMGRGCAFFTVGVSIFNIWSAENKVKAGLREGLVLGGGAAGGAVAGAATGLVCGPGAPICSTALFVVGGIMGALAGDAAGRIMDDELTELSSWLEESW